MALQLIMPRMTSLKRIQQMPIAWLISCFPTMPPIFHLSAGILLSLKSKFLVLHSSVSWLKTPLGTTGSLLMKLSGRVNGLSVLPPFAGNHDNRLWSQAWLYTGTTGGLHPADCRVTRFVWVEEGLLMLEKSYLRIPTLFRAITSVIRRQMEICADNIIYDID